MQNLTRLNHLICAYGKKTNNLHPDLYQENTTRWAMSPRTPSCQVRFNAYFSFAATHGDCSDWQMYSFHVAIGFQSHYLNFQQHPHSFHQTFRCTEEIQSLPSNAPDGNALKEIERHNSSSSGLNSVKSLNHFTYCVRS